jgi:hypothetical protein
MAVKLSPLAGAGWQFFDNLGIPLAGGLLYTYTAGTTTPQATYTSTAGTIANANPIVLDSAGRTANEVWLTVGVAYKFVLQTPAATTIGTYDNISGINDITGATSGTSILRGDGSGGFANVTVGSGLSYVGGTLSSTTSSGVTSVAMTVPPFLTVSGSPITSTGTLAVALSTSALPVMNGGTGLTSLTSKSALIGMGTAAISSLAPGTANNVMLSDGTNWTSGSISGIVSAAVPAGVAGITAGAVGSMAFARAAGPLAYGDTIAGSSLRYSNSANDPSTNNPSGTWKCLGYIFDSSPLSTLFLRTV